MPNVVYTYSLTFRAPVGVFSGLGVAGLVDRTMVRDARGLPYIPGSSVKGRLRFFAERLLRSGTPLDGYRLHADTQPICKEVAQACTLCHLFGNPAIPGLLRVGQASPAPPWDMLFRDLLKADRNPVLHRDAEIRPGIALSRMRRTALPDHLFFDEVVPAITFAGQLSLDTRVSPAERRFLVSVGALVDALGARKAVGRGCLSGGIRIEESAA
jgi:CRISPR/Cas system CSM-associated protein Csm3 (group 7 of RAMP superfamily)